MPGRKIVVGINFNAMHLHDRRFDPGWIEKRINIFREFTLKSLINQSQQDFLALLQYEEKTEESIWQALSKFPPLPDNIEFVRAGKYEDRILKYVGDSPEFYIARIDSDDMYHQSFMKLLHEYQPGSEHVAVLIPQDGYIYDSINHRLAHWSHYSPPFYTLIYQTSDFLRRIRYKLIGGHSKMIRFNHEILPPGYFMVVVHRENSVTSFNRSQRGKIITEERKIEQILNDFRGK